MAASTSNLKHRNSSPNRNSSHVIRANNAVNSETHDLSGVPKNNRGGVLVTEQEIAQAFKFFDVDDSGRISSANLRKRLGVFYKDMPAKDYRYFNEKLLKHQFIFHCLNKIKIFLSALFFS
jgi:Ca2+-binding EF-hand superfamily protein